MNRKNLVGLILLLVLLLSALFFQNEAEVDLSQRLLKPCLEYPFGTDSFGRNLLERVSSGYLFSFFFSLIVTILSTVFGFLLSLLMVRDDIVGSLSRRFSDAMKALPAILLSLFLVSLFGQKLSVLLIALVISQTPNLARTSQARILVLRKEEYVEALRSQGIGDRRIAYHYWIHLYPILIDQSLSIFSTTILTESGLSFIGAGLPIKIASLGSIMAEGRSFLFTSPFLFLIPSSILFLTGIALYLLKSDSSSH